jgi:hypothetical protein
MRFALSAGRSLDNQVIDNTRHSVFALLTTLLSLWLIEIDGMVVDTYTAWQ